MNPIKKLFNWNKKPPVKEEVKENAGNVDIGKLWYFSKRVDKYCEEVMNQ